MRKMPAKLGNIWIAKAKIQIISDRGTWETLAVCMDAPNPIETLAQKLIKQGCSRSKLWVTGPATGRKMV